ncbi:hypothetical protein [Nocardia noduli]|uniref:hypothetical protein n=1 Tax=Nocardia noduli TaxID=2815722 RepID=UPI001C21663A|nr:hypothetical protein [Nocardia noduli]
MAAIGVDLVRSVLADNVERPARSERSRDATLRVRSTWAGMAVIEIGDVRVPTVTIGRRAHAQPYHARPRRPLYRFYRLARLRIGPPQADGVPTRRTP